jgi:hypothetical protein
VAKGACGGGFSALVVFKIGLRAPRRMDAYPPERLHGPLPIRKNDTSV